MCVINTCFKCVSKRENILILRLSCEQSNSLLFLELHYLGPLSATNFTNLHNKQAEKNELRKEKLALKADKTRMEQQLKTTRVSPAGFMPAHPAAAYQAGPNNMPVFPSYSFVPMWHYLPPSVRDTSHDHELRPPAA